MALNFIWVAFFLIAFVVALYNLLVHHDTETMKRVVDSTFDSSKVAFELSIGLTGLMTLWLGIMNIGEKAGAVNVLSRLIGPLFNRLFPGIPKDHPAHGQILMNFSANMLGLGNAATPMGLKAMQSMQEINTDKETASNAQIMFLVLNTAGFTLLPVQIMMFRAQLGAENPADVFIPILLASFTATLFGVAAVAIKQGINIFDKVIMLWMLGVISVLAGVVYFFSTLDHDKISLVSTAISSLILLSIITAFICAALFKKINVFEAFIEGAKGGFETAVKIIPYMVAMLVGIAVFRASDAMNIIISGLADALAFVGVNTDFTGALPTALMKPLSGSGARGLMIDAMKTYGVDSFAGRLSCIFQGAADTTFYIVALYFGSVGIKKTRYAVSFGLLADLFGFIAAILIAYMFFH